MTPAPPPGYRRNSRYAAGSRCPSCGRALVVLDAPLRYASPRRLAADDREVRAVSGDGFKAERRTVRWVHTATLRCSGCGRMLSPAQADREPPRAADLPADWFVRDEPDTPEARALMFAAISAGLRDAAARRREAARGPAITVPSAGEQARIDFRGAAQEEGRNGPGQDGPGAKIN